MENKHWYEVMDKIYDCCLSPDSTSLYSTEICSIRVYKTRGVKMENGNKEQTIEIDIDVKNTVGDKHD